MGEVDIIGSNKALVWLEGGFEIGTRGSWLTPESSTHRVNELKGANERLC